jgi:hypothetical protein
MGLGQNPPRDHLIIIPAALDSRMDGVSDRTVISAII